MLLTLALASDLVTAQDTNPSPPSLATVQVSASLLPITAAAASQHVTVLTRADLDALGPISIAEALALQAGVVVDRSPRSGGYGSLYLRGAKPSHVVVLVDYVRQNDPLSSRGSAVDLNTLSTGDVERIEIVRGNVSVVHAEALAGLIHIFTRRAPGTGYAGVAAGGQGLRAAQAGFAGEQLRGSISLREEGDSSTGLNSNHSFNAAWEQPLDRNGTVAFTARLADSTNLAFPDDSGGQQYAVRRSLESRNSRSSQLAARAAINTESSGRIELQAATLGRDGQESSPGVAPGLRDPAGLPPITTQTDYRRHEFQALWMPVTTSTDLLVTVGLTHQHETGRLNSNISFGRFVLPASFSMARGVTSLMAEALYQWQGWTLQGGLRHERPNLGDATTHPMVSIQQALGEGFGKWGASISKTAKLPSFYALGHPLVGNAGLRIERATHHELYYASSERAAWPVRITLFSARYQDLIDFDAGPPPRLLNRARINTDGVEWRASHVLANGWRLTLDGAFMQVKNPDGGTDLRQRPRTQASAQLHVPFSYRGELLLVARHLGRRLDSAIPTGDQWLPTSNALDVSARMPVPALGGAVATIAIDNLTNSRAAEAIGTPTPSRRLRVAFNWSL